MRHFGKRVNHDPNGVATIRNKEVGYKIHRDGLPGRVMQFQGLKKAGRRVAWSFIILVFVIIPDVITNQAGDTGPPKVPGNKFQCFIYSHMAGDFNIVFRFENSLLERGWYL